MCSLDEAPEEVEEGVGADSASSSYDLNSGTDGNKNKYRQDPIIRCAGQIYSPA